MLKSLTRLWLGGMQQVAKAQRSQQKKLLKSLLPKPPKKTRSTVRAAPKRAVPTTAAAAPKPSPPSAPAAATSARLPGKWMAFYYSSLSDGGTLPARRMQYWLYWPASVPAGPVPLVVMLHGCTQSASLIDNETGWTKWADTYQFALVLPEQKTPNNPSRCFNWWLPGDQSRGSGESLSVKQMTDWMKTTYGTDAARIFVTGLLVIAGACCR